MSDSHTDARHDRQWTSLPVLFVCMFAMVLFGCGPDETGGVSSTVERGPFSATVTADRDSLTMADRLAVEVSVTGPSAAQITFPLPGERVGEFLVISYETPSPVPAGTDIRTSVRSYLLEPFLPGEYEVPAIEVRYEFPTNVVGTARSGVIRTEPVPIVVESLIKGETAEIDDIVGPKDPPPSRTALYVMMALLALAALVFLVFRMRKRTADTDSAPVVLPHETAFRELHDIEARGLIEAGLMKMYYQLVSGVLRRYIEARFGLHAPERTTEEFLEELRGSSVLEPAHTSLLERFLAHCDLVKFAEHQPGPDDIKQTLASCRAFIEETREDK